MLHPLNVATPEESAVTGLIAQARLASGVPVPDARDRRTEPDAGLPPLSRTLTAGCVSNAVPPVPPPGVPETGKDSCDARPSETVRSAGWDAPPELAVST